MNMNVRVLGVAKHALSQSGLKAAIVGDVLAVSNVGFFGAPKTVVDVRRAGFELADAVKLYRSRTWEREDREFFAAIENQAAA